MSKVFLLDACHRPLNPIHPALARWLLTHKKAAVFRQYPFTLILNRAIDDPNLKPLRLKIDPGSKTTGLALVDDVTGSVEWAGELNHRGTQIRDALTSRRQRRRSRRNRKTRYRQPRFNNRTRPKGWLPPSLMSRVHNISTWVKRLLYFTPAVAISIELVRFDLQQMENPEISGVEYSHGTLAGYEIREYLLQKWHRQCAYCGQRDVPLQIEHIVPRAKGGSDRVSNLCLSCEPCNIKKGTKDIKVILAHKPDVLNRILAQSKKPLADAAAVNATRWALYRKLQETGNPVEVGSGGRTGFNRVTQGLEKKHWIDAACVGSSTPQKLIVDGVKPLIISAKGHGTRQQCRTDKHGFPIRYCSRTKFHKGFQTGDIVKAVVTEGKKVGVYTGRVATRATGSFNILTTLGLIQGINYKFCKHIHKKDGYAYA